MICYPIRMSKTFFATTLLIAATILIFSQARVSRTDAVVITVATKSQPDNVTTENVTFAFSKQTTVRAEPGNETRISGLRRLLFEDPYSWSHYENLLVVARDPKERDLVFALLLDLQIAFPDNRVLQEAFGNFHIQSGEYDLAIPYLESIKTDTERAGPIRRALSVALLDSGSPEAAIEEAQMVHMMIHSNAKAQPTEDSFKQVILDGDLWKSCIVQALGHLNQERIRSGRAALQLCFANLGVLADEVAESSAAIIQIAAQLEDWRGMSFNDVMVALD